MEKWRGKYRVSSSRLQNYDYRTNGAYFITICTHQHLHFFGECLDSQMKLSTIGAIVQGFWYEIPKHFSFVSLGEFVVMPNHVHGILILNNSVPVQTLQCNVSTTSKNEFFSTISPNAGSVSTIVRSYKSVCSKHIHLTFPEQNFRWQARFYDNVIRDEQAYEKISNYVLNNPLLWENDKFHQP
jgi:REP element-mobilizing transposase RayT